MINLLGSDCSRVRPVVTALLCLGILVSARRSPQPGQVPIGGLPCIRGVKLCDFNESTEWESDDELPEGKNGHKVQEPGAWYYGNKEYPDIMAKMKDRIDAEVGVDSKAKIVMHGSAWHGKVHAKEIREEHTAGFASALAWVGFTVYGMFCVYVGNHSNVEMQVRSHRLFSRVVAIFAAMVSVSAFNKIVFVMLLGCSDLTTFIAQMTLFMLMYVFMSWCCYRHNESEEALHVIQEFVMHIVAFMAVEAVKEGQYHCAQYIVEQSLSANVFQNLTMLYVGTPVLAWLGFFFLRRLTKTIRLCFPFEIWTEIKHDILEMELEASAIVVGMVFVNAVEFVINLSVMGPSPVPVKCSDGVPSCPTMPHQLLEGTGVCMAFALVIAVLTFHLQQTSSYTNVQAIMEEVHIHCVMIVGWLMFNITRWTSMALAMHLSVWAPMFLSVSFRRVLLVFVLAPLCLICLMCFDKLARSGLLRRSTITPINNALGLWIAIELASTYQGTFRRLVSGARENGRIFGESEGAVLITEVCLCIFTAAIMMPAWRWYIVPQVVNLPSLASFEASLPQMCKLQSLRGERKTRHLCWSWDEEERHEQLFS